MAEDLHRRIMERLRPYVSEEQLKRFWLYKSSRSHLHRPDDNSSALVFVLFDYSHHYFDPIFVGECEVEEFYEVAQSIKDLFITWLGNENIADAQPGEALPHAWKNWFECYNPQIPKSEDANKSLALFRFKFFCFEINNAVERKFWTAALVNTLRPICNNEVYEDEVGRAISFDGITPDMTEQMMLKHCQWSSGNIQHFPNAPGSIKLAAIKSEPWALATIMAMGIRPSDEMIEEALRSDGLLIRIIDEPSAEHQLLAVQQNADALQYIKNPGREVQIAALDQDPYALEHIKDPIPDIALMAVQRDANSVLDLNLQYLSNHPEILIAALEGNPSLYRDFEFLTEELIDIAREEVPIVLLEDIRAGLEVDRELIARNKEKIIRKILQLLKTELWQYSGQYNSILEQLEFDWSEIKIVGQAIETLELEEQQRENIFEENNQEGPY